MANDSHSTQTPTGSSADRLLRLSDVLFIVGLSRSTVLSLVKRGLFPAPSRITGTRASRWSSADVNAWCQLQLRKD